jgi:hypothetical protein
MDGLLVAAILPENLVIRLPGFTQARGVSCGTR